PPPPSHALRSQSTTPFIINPWYIPSIPLLEKVSQLPKLVETVVPTFVGITAKHLLERVTELVMLVPRESTDVTHERASTGAPTGPTPIWPLSPACTHTRLRENSSCATTNIEKPTNRQFARSPTSPPSGSATSLSPTALHCSRKTSCCPPRSQFCRFLMSKRTSTL
ncbi:hypothetical protein M408DRAFT_320853, partial [Serendipita vermifera MAFF 305830]